MALDLSTPRNAENNRYALERVAWMAWRVNRPYPGSDVRWDDTECLLCGATGLSIFYSHMRRDRIRHKGCLPPAERPAALAAYRAKHPEITEPTPKNPTPAAAPKGS